MNQLTNLVVTYDQFLADKDSLINRGVLVAGMPNDEYHKHEGISNSGLKLVKRSPAHYKYPEPFNHTRAKEIGSAIHAAIFELEWFKSKWVILDEIQYRTEPDYKKAAKALGGAFVLTGVEGRQIRGMYQAVRKHKRAIELLQEPGWSELSGFKRDENGIIRKVRFDRLTISGKILDLKKCQDARPREFSKSIGNYDYHMQAAWYLDTFNLITGLDADGFRFIAVEEKSPHGVAVYPIDEPSLMIGRDDYQEAYATYLECVQTDAWPAYSDDEQEISVPSWKVYEWEEKQEQAIGEFNND